jgi:hypothetical protein
MEDIQNPLEADRVDCAKGVAFEGVTDLQNAAAEAFKRLGVCRIFTELRLKRD